MDYANGSGAFAQPTKSYATEARLSLFGDVNGQITAAMGRVIEATATARNVADALYGSEPATATKISGNSATTGVPHIPPRADETRNNLAALHDAITTLEYQVNRLNQLA